MDTLWQDVRYAVRVLARSPAFTAVAVLVLALGLGLNTAIFSIINAVLFRVLPVRAPGELMYVYHQRPDWSIGYRDYLFLRDRNDVFATIFATGGDRAAIGTGGQAEWTRGEMVTANYFDALGVKAMRGRTFVPEQDEASGAPPVVVISDGLWRRRFDANPEIVGSSIQLVLPGIPRTDQQPDYTVIGITPPEFKGLSTWQPTEYWVPLVQRAGDWNRGERDPLARTAVVPVGRLKPRVARAQARAVITALGAQLRHVSPERERSRDWGLVLLDARRVSLPFAPRGEVVPDRLAAGLMAVSAMVLLIAAANLAGMLMARGVTRANEIAVRLALGAGRWRTTRQFLAESVLIAIAAGALGLAIARLLVHAFLNNMPAQVGRFGSMRISFDVPVDGHVLLFTLLLCVAAGVGAGLAPALRASKADVIGALSGASATPARTRWRLRYWIVIPQICLSLVLLVGAGTLVRPLLRTEAVEPGYEADNVVLVDFDLPSPGRYKQQTREVMDSFLQRRTQFYGRLLERAKALPDAEAVSLVMLGLPLTRSGTWFIRREDFASGQHRWLSSATVSSGYFKAMGIRLLRGRLFGDRDGRSTPGVAVVCEAAARQLWPGKNPIGQYLAQHWPDSSYPPRWLEVIGVVNEVKPALSEGGSNPYVYVALEQQERPLAVSVIGRGRGRPGDLLKGLRDAVSAADVDAQILGSQTMNEAIAALRYPRRITAAILAISGLIGLLLASAGLYGVVSYSVAQRLREMGIRAALGARRIDITRLVLGDGLRILLVSAVAGSALAFGALRVTASLVVAFPKADAVTFIVVPVLLGAVILLACYLPARRASRVDPVEVLRAL